MRFRKIAYCDYFLKYNDFRIASEKAGYAPNYGYKLRNDPDVIEYIKKKRLEYAQEAKIEAVALMKEAANIAHFNPKSIVDDEGRIKPIIDLTDNEAAAVASVREDKEGIVIPDKFHPKLQAITVLLDYMKNENINENPVHHYIQVIKKQKNGQVKKELPITNGTNN